jgi:hypothetical protein
MQVSCVLSFDNVKTPAAAIPRSATVVTVLHFRRGGAASSKASKNSFDTPLERYQKVSPVAGDAKAVT